MPKKIGLLGIAVIIVQQFLLTKKTNKVMNNQAEAAQELVAFKQQLVKSNGEIQTKMQTLVDAANNADQVSPELQAAIDDLAAPIQQLDDIVPDAVAEQAAPPADDGTVVAV